MSENVISLQAIADKPVQSVVDTLANALKLAQQGHLRSVAVSGVLASGNVHRAYDTDNLPYLLGALACTQAGLMHDMHNVPPQEPDGDDE